MINDHVTIDGIKRCLATLTTEEIDQASIAIDLDGSDDIARYASEHFDEPTSGAAWVIAYAMAHRAVHGDAFAFQRRSFSEIDAIHAADVAA